MKKIKVRKEDFVVKSKEEVLQIYDLTKDEYNYIRHIAISKDSKGMPLDEWEMEIPDFLGANINSKLDQTYIPPMCNCQMEAKYGNPSQQLPFLQPEQIYTLQQQYQRMAQECMEEAKWNYDTAENERLNFRTPEEYNYFIECGNHWQQLAEYHLNMAAMLNTI